MARQANWLERWLARWDARNQRTVERQAVADRRARGRTVAATAPDGTVYQVLAVKAGYPLRDPGPPLEDGGGLWPVAMAAWQLVHLVAWVRHRPQGGWTVGVLRPRRLWWEQVVHRERLGPADDEVARVAELARQIGAGTFTPAQAARPQGPPA